MTGTTSTTRGVWYATREDVAAAKDIKLSARNKTQIDRALEHGSRAAEARLHRRFFPWTGIRYFDWPNLQYADTWRLWLDQDELVSMSAITIAGTAGTVGQFMLRPDHGPPYNRVECDLSTAAAFAAGATHQRAIAITGVYCGCAVDEVPAGTVAEALDSSETGVDVSDSGIIGVGQIIRVDDERMIVTEKAMLTTGQTLQTPLTASNSNVTVAVTTGSGFNVGETILLDSERMLIVDIAGNNLTVLRAWDGTVLAAHSGSTIYAPRTLTVTRGALGTTAAAHNTSTAVVKSVFPGPVHALTVAEAVVYLEQESAGFARTAGAGDNERETAGRGLADLREQAYTSHGRKARTRAV